MLAAHLDPLPAALFSLLAIGSLLLSFVMLGSRWLRHYLYAFAAQSWLIAVLSGAVGFYGGYAELYIVAVLTAAFRGLLLPYLILRIIRRLKVSREIHVILQPSSSLVIGAFAVLFALAVSYRIGAALDLAGTIVVLALTVMLSMKLIGFLMLSVRHEAISQILGLLVLENGVFLGAQILVPGMPLLIEIVILFDLLVVVACFGVLVQYLLTPCRNDELARAQATGGLMSAIGFFALAMTLLAPATAIVLVVLISRPRPAEMINLMPAPSRSPRSCAILLTAPRSSVMFWNGYVVIDGLGAWTIFCAALVYFLASMYAVGYMRLIDAPGAPSSLLRAVRRLRAQHVDRTDDEQCRSLLDRN